MEMNIIKNVPTSFNFCHNLWPNLSRNVQYWEIQRNRHDNLKHSWLGIFYVGKIPGKQGFRFPNLRLGSRRILDLVPEGLSVDLAINV